MNCFLSSTERQSTRPISNTQKSPMGTKEIVQKIPKAGKSQVSKDQWS